MKPPRRVSISDAAPDRRGVFALALGIFVLTGIVMLLTGATGKVTGWPAAVFVVIAAITSTIAQSRQLPIQNALLAIGIIVVIASLAETVWFVLSNYAGNSLLGCWTVPLLWITALLNSRGVAKLVLDRRQDSTRYGFEIMTLTIALGIALFLAALPIASDAGSTTFQFASAADFGIQLAGRSFTAFVILLVATPALINKKPVKFRRDYQPLLLWTFVMLCAAARMGYQGLWLSAAVVCAAAAFVMFLAIRVSLRLSRIER